MSQTFTSRPSLISRRRGADRGGLKGASTSSRSSHPDICARSTETSGAPNRSKSTSNSKMSYGSRVTQPGSYSSLNNTRTGATGRGRMDYTQNPNLGPSGGADDEAQQNDVERKEQNAGGFTVIPRNEKKWQKIKQVAQKETADYEKFKEANKGQSYHYVGTVGGGQLSEEQVRARQAQQVRAAKYNRQMKQAEQRQAARKAEEDAIEAKRAEARRKAELNAQREAGAAPAVQVRRNREAFLAQLEKKSPAKPSTSSQWNHTEPLFSSPIKGPEQGRENKANNNSAKPLTPSRLSYKVSTSPAKSKSPKSQATSASNGRDLATSQQARIKTEPQVFHNKKSPHDVGGRQVNYGVKAELREDSKEAFVTSERDEEIQNLLSMYPNMAAEYLADLLYQAGSIDGVTEALEFDDY